MFEKLDFCTPKLTLKGIRETTISGNKVYRFGIMMPYTPVAMYAFLSRSVRDVIVKMHDTRECFRPYVVLSTMCYYESAEAALRAIMQSLQTAQIPVGTLIWPLNDGKLKNEEGVTRG